MTLLFYCLDYSELLAKTETYRAILKIAIWSGYEKFSI